jgi:hypothetical protein
MLGKGSGKFNYKAEGAEGKKDNAGTFQIPFPVIRYYYRTFVCQLEKFGKNNTKRHYINVFTRPLGYTRFPVMFDSGNKPLKEGGFLKHSDDVDCNLKKLYGDGLEVGTSEKKKDTYIGAPFQFYWKFPKYSRDGKAEELSEDEVEHQRPPNGEIYWGKQKLHKKELTASSIVERQPTDPKAMVRIFNISYLTCKSCMENSMRQNSKVVKEELSGIRSAASATSNQKEHIISSIS